MNKKFTSTVAGASIFIAVFGFLSKGLGFFREVIFASIFGLTVDFDIYLVAAVLPLTINIVVNCLGQNYLIPAYNKLKEQNEDSSDNFILTNFYLFISGGFIISVLLYLFSDSIIFAYLQNANPELKETATNIFNLFLITIPINGAVSVITAYQQSNFEFRFTVVSQLILNLIVLVVVVSMRSLAIYSIPVGYVIGSILQLIFLLSRSGKNFFFNLNLTKSIKQFGKFVSSTLIIIILIESIGQLYVIADRFFYDMVPDGGISALNFAQNIFLLPISILSIALSTAIFPRFAQLKSKNLNSELEKVFNDGIVINIAIFVPVMFVFLLYGEVLLKIIYERGKFSESDTIITSSVLFYYSLSIVFYAVYGVLNKIIYSIGLINKLLIITISGIVIKVVLNYIFVENMMQDGLALSSSISYLFFFFTALYIIYKNILFKNKTIFFAELIFHLFNSTLSFYLVKQVSFLLPAGFLFIVLEIILFIMIVTMNVFLLKNSSAQIIIRMLKNLKAV